MKVVAKEPAGQRELSDPRVQQAIRTQLHDRREQLLKSAYYPSTATIPAYYIDLGGSIPVGDHVELRAGVNNIADKNPPLILNGALTDCPNTTCNNNTWVGTYDTLGRYIYFNVTAQF